MIERETTSRAHPPTFDPRPLAHEVRRIADPATTCQRCVAALDSDEHAVACLGAEPPASWGPPGRTASMSKHERRPVRAPSGWDHEGVGVVAFDDDEPSADTAATRRDRFMAKSELKRLKDQRLEDRRRALDERHRRTLRAKFVEGQR
jgi:hypothetical protein